MQQRQTRLRLRLFCPRYEIETETETLASHYTRSRLRLRLCKLHMRDRDWDWDSVNSFYEIETETLETHFTRSRLRLSISHLSHKKFIISRHGPWDCLDLVWIIDKVWMFNDKVFFFISLYKPNVLCIWQTLRLFSAWEYYSSNIHYIQYRVP